MMSLGSHDAYIVDALVQIPSVHHPAVDAQQNQGIKLDGKVPLEVKLLQVQALGIIWLAHGHRMVLRFLPQHRHEEHMTGSQRLVGIPMQPLALPDDLLEDAAQLAEDVRH